MDKIKKTNMNIKKITIAMLITLISIGNINAQEMKTEIPKISEFPTGNENTGFEQYFSGKSWLAPLTSNKGLNVPMFNVTFEPNCRNHRLFVGECNQICQVGSREQNRYHRNSPRPMKSNTSALHQAQDNNRRRHHQKLIKVIPALHKYGL